jgi:hypothetical protein
MRNYGRRRTKTNAYHRKPIKKVAEQKRSLKLLEDAVDVISRVQVDFVEGLNKCEERLVTLDTNTKNIEEYLLTDPIFDRRRGEIDKYLAGPLRLSRDQIKNDIRYLSATQRQANRTLRSIQTMAGLRSRRIERALTILLGAFVVLEFFHAFRELEHVPWWGRASIIVVSFVVLAFGLKYWFWRESRRND